MTLDLQFTWKHWVALAVFMVVIVFHVFYPHPSDAGKVPVKVSHVDLGGTRVQSRCDEYGRRVYVTWTDVAAGATVFVVPDAQECVR